MMNATKYETKTHIKIIHKYQEYSTKRLSFLQGQS